MKDLGDQIIALNVMCCSLSVGLVCAFSQPPGIKQHCELVRLNKSTLKCVTIATFR